MGALIQALAAAVRGCCTLRTAREFVSRCGLAHDLEDEDVVQIVKKKVVSGEDGRGRFKTKSDAPLRIADREKKPALKT